MSQLNETVVGIDLGTTNSCIGYFHGGHFEIVPIDGAATIPSVIALTGGEWLIGQAALNHYQIYPEEALRSVKRHIGNELSRLKVAGVDITPKMASAKILSYLKTKAEEHLQVPLERAVITVPAWFDEVARRHTLEAGRAAGWQVMQIINEPTAASLAYELFLPTQSASQGKRLALMDEFGAGVTNQLVFDLGGGTFDVSVVSCEGEQRQVLSSCGERFLGGDDFDEALIDYLHNQLQREFGIDFSADAVCMARTRVAAEKAKIHLSTAVYADVDLQLVFEGKPYRTKISIERRDFEQLIEPYVHAALDRVEEAVSAAGLVAEELNQLLLVGGSSRIPIFTRLLKDRWQLSPDCYIDPDRAVALGAAVQAAHAAQLSFDRVIIDVASQTLGVAALGELDDQEDQAPLAMQLPKDLDDQEAVSLFLQQGHPKTFAPLIRKNSRIPCSMERQFYTASENQTRMEIAMYQGENSSTRENTFIGSFSVNIPPAPAMTPITVSFEYDANGMVKAKVYDFNRKLQGHFSLNLGSELSSQIDHSTLSLLREKNAHWQGEDQDEDEYEEPEPHQELEKAPGKISNRLVLSVELALEAQPDQGVSQLLDRYRDALELQDDDLADKLEDQLFDWLDERAEGGHDHGQ